MRKVINMAATFALVLSVSLTAFAADTTIIPDENGDPDPASGSTAVTLSVDPTYTITIPATVELEKVDGTEVTYENDLKITASADMRLDEGKQVTVTMESDSYDGSFYLTNGGSYQLAYTVEVDSASIASGDVVAEFTTSVDEQTSTLHIAADDPEYAGSYSDTVVFTIAVTDID